jgi:energy-coupling factor transport system permease protein
MTGQPQTGSVLNQLDPRVKILLALLLTALVFIIDSPPVAAGQALVFLGLSLAVNMPLRTIFAHARFLAFLIALIIALQMLFGPVHRADWYILKPLIPAAVPLIGGRGALSWDGLFLGLAIGCRLAALVMVMPMLTMTTPPRLLALGLTKMGLNYRAAYIITTAFNLVPALEAEARVIMDARKLRGLRAFDNGGLVDRLKEYPALTLPLIINAMRRAQAVGIAMDARAFGAYRNKTWLEDIRLSPRDYAAFAAAAAYAALVLTLHFAL